MGLERGAVDHVAIALLEQFQRLRFYATADGWGGVRNTESRNPSLRNSLLSIRATAAGGKLAERAA